MFRSHSKYPSINNDQSFYFLCKICMRKLFAYHMRDLIFIEHWCMGTEKNDHFIIVFRKVTLSCLSQTRRLCISQPIWWHTCVCRGGPSLWQVSRLMSIACGRSVGGACGRSVGGVCDRSVLGAFGRSEHLWVRGPLNCMPDISSFTVKVTAKSKWR